MGLLIRRYRKDLVKAILLWLLLALSVGWYYTFTYYGRTGIPVPLPEPCAALIVYYFSVVNGASTSFQAAHWVLIFPVAGLLWVGVLHVTAPWFGGRREHFGWAAGRLSRTLLPVIAPLPVVAWLGGATPGGFSFDRMIDVALRRAGAPAPWWLTPAYIGLGLAALWWQFKTYRRVYDIYGKKAVYHLLISAVVLALLAVGIGALAAYPLRHAFQPALF